MVLDAGSLFIMIWYIMFEQTFNHIIISYILLFILKLLQTYEPYNE